MAVCARIVTFINQLVDLYKELQQANMTVLDLQHLDQVEKQEDLLRIFSAAQDLLLAGDFDNQSKLSASLQGNYLRTSG